MYPYVISFFLQQGNVKSTKKLMKIVLTQEIFISSEQLLEILMKFCRKDVTSDTIKSHKKQGFTISLEDFGKITWS